MCARYKPRSRPAPQEPGPPEPPRLKGAALLTAWQQLLEQPHVASDLFLIGTSAGAATCADDIHAIGNELDRLIERTQEKNDPEVGSSILGEVELSISRVECG